MAIFASGGLAGAVVAAAAAVCLASGCSTLGYYAQAATGHLNIVTASRPVAEWLADPATPPRVKERLELSQRIRDFAVSELGEPDNASYRRYADLGRSAAVWNVVAAPELSLTLKTWCFVVVGCVGYRGYYSEAGAAAEADALRRAGYEALVYPVPAYSTLGRLPGDWLADPLLNTFLHYPEPDLARLIFHELAHQIVYVPGDTAFNESFATAVEQLGSARWLAAHGNESLRAQQAGTQARRAEFRALTLRYRSELQALYASSASDADKRARKAALFAAMRAEHAALKATRWNGYAGYDAWFARANNASLGVLAAYNDLVPQFETLFRQEGGDFARFYAEVRRIAALPAGARRARLGAAAAASSPPP
jgi:predicted aminopeptidase